MNSEICPENISHLKNDKNNDQANCLNINESGYELTSRDLSLLHYREHNLAATLFIYIKNSNILLSIGSSNWYISNKKFFRF